MRRFPDSRRRVLGLLLYFAVTVSAQTRHASYEFPPDTLALRPPATPLVITDPFLSQWLPSDNLTDTYTVHWTIIFGGNGYKAMSALVRIDGETYRLLGPECPAGQTPALQQLGYARVYPSSTVVRYAGAGIELNLTFTQPVFGDGIDRGINLPISYVTFDVGLTDGRNHSVQIYFDATAQLAVNIDSQEVEWARVTNLSTPAAQSVRIGTSKQSIFDGFGDDFRIDWGWLHVAAAPPAVTSPFVLSSAAASSNLMRTWFVNNGTLPPDETIMPLSACSSGTNYICGCHSPGGTGAGNDWPALGLAWDLGTLVPATGDQVASVFGVLAYDDVLSARFFGQPQLAYWRSGGRTFAQLLDHALQQYESVMARSVAGDLTVVEALRAAATLQSKESSDAASLQAASLTGETYERLASLSFRQTLAANKLAWYDGAFNVSYSPSTAHLWVKGCGSSGDTGTLDDNLPAVPYFLWTMPELVPAFLSPLFMWAANETWASPDAPYPRNMTFDAPYAPHYLGQFPDAELQCWNNPAPYSNCEQMPIEMSASAIHIVAAHALQTGDYTFAERWWTLLARWASYLALNGLYPEVQLSSDDYEGPIANSTHLAAKAFIALGAFSQLANATGRVNEGAEAWTSAVLMRDAWLSLAVDPVGSGGPTEHTMITYNAPNSSSIKYSILFDVALGLGLFPKALLASECAFLATSPETSQPFGWILQNPPNAVGGHPWTNLGWLGFIAAVCPSQATALYERILDFVNSTQPRFPLTDWYDTSTAAYVGFSARAQVGGLFATVWLQNLMQHGSRPATSRERAEPDSEYSTYTSLRNEDSDLD